MTNKLEIYSQRYETFRHLDKLRWQMLQIAVATGAVVLALGKEGSSMPSWWIWAAIGLVFLLCGTAMLKIGEGIRKNGVALHQAGKEIGDEEIPIPSTGWRSVSVWVAGILVIIGVICIALSFCLLIWG